MYNVWYRFMNWQPGRKYTDKVRLKQQKAKLRNTTTYYLPKNDTIGRDIYYAFGIQKHWHKLISSVLQSFHRANWFLLIGNVGMKMMILVSFFLQVSADFPQL